MVGNRSNGSNRQQTGPWLKKIYILIQLFLSHCGLLTVEGLKSGVVSYP